MEYRHSAQQIKKKILAKLEHNFGVGLENATNDQLYKSVALLAREMMEQGRSEFMAEAEKKQAKQVYYLCMEFLLGRSLKNTLFNLGIEEAFREALQQMDVKLETLYDCEPDAGLGNGGLGRLAACFMDALATGQYPSTGYSLCYEYGIFRQKLVDGWQTELPDFWLPGGRIWLHEIPEKAVEVHFRGHVEEHWDSSYHETIHKDYTTILAIPCDLFIAGMGGKGISRLRLWKSKGQAFDMGLFNSGNYMRAMEENAMAETITKVLYPDDNHSEGKSLRLTQQYFLVSASIQDIIRTHLFQYSTLDNLPEKVAIHMNDTHPVLAIPELMRIMLDECGYDWDRAWDLTTRTLAYTNHTVMKEALECWDQDLFRMQLPRIYQIVEEINRRFCQQMHDLGVDGYKVGRMAPLNDGYVKMANLAVVGSHCVNGVSTLHSEILKETVFHDFYTEMPDKFTNVTNGIAHRRWLNQSNPELAALLTEKIGKEYIYDASQLKKLEAYKEDKTVLQELAKIKRRNKERLAAYIARENHLTLDPNSIFDVQVKRMHEYKRQHLNALNILATYLWLKSHPNADFTPHTYIFGAKAAPGYYFAKQMIRFIYELGEVINHDPAVSSRMKVVYVEDYRVTLAELMIPAADISEQISLAGTEASGTSNMKFMINGAVTLGTLDGANVEIHDSVGDDNMLLFGMTTPEVEALRAAGYHPDQIYYNNPAVHGAIDFLRGGINGVDFSDIANSLTGNDPYMVLADFESYQRAQAKAMQLYANPETWQRMCLCNIANAGRFAADRAIREYAERIWHCAPLTEKTEN
ncbi:MULTISPECIES: glycogen/starch/alpha-glucan phosphorylase [Caproicibacterium]|uniref:Alpha-1,4 glucan phosphorylase n=1 Tax=Caproicibacterium argilliputei TaxID=3030016 RepID=A0AA97DAK6_9FIRM|nr:glycogen/starch/alpha-glucan phosphorylase [Caproicibacterium argilliputei]WOC32339.1 glycogen/starch/alpha-glucan phosphorylase [Caproicibacterium argilliputei]